VYQQYKNSQALPIYSKVENIRDWLFVEDHAKAIDMIFHNGEIDQTYNLGGFNEWKNINIVKLLCKVMDKKLGRLEGTSEKLITYVTDRAGDDMRYAIDANKIKEELGWEPSLQFEEGMEKTVDWYLANEE
jgi:dTDP-glucose 4,6-dehydratase